MVKDKDKVKVKDRVKGLDSLRYLRGAIASEPDPPALHAAGCRSSAVDVGVFHMGPVRLVFGGLQRNGGGQKHEV